MANSRVWIACLIAWPLGRVLWSWWKVRPGLGREAVLAARLAGLDPVVAELAADRLAAAQILARVRPLEFFHPLIGAAVREDIAPGRAALRIGPPQTSSIVMVRDRWPASRRTCSRAAQRETGG